MLQIRAPQTPTEYARACPHRARNERGVERGLHNCKRRDCSLTSTVMPRDRPLEFAFGVGI
jgi:hypothetical protein